MSNGKSGQGKRIETEVVDPDAPVRFVRLVIDGEEMPLIPWDEAEAVANVVESYDDTRPEQ